MDKRTLYFVIAMSIALFGINSFFSYLDQDRAKEWHEQQKQQKLKFKNQLVEQINQGTVPLAELPIVKLYADKEQTLFLTYAANLGGSLATTSQEMPETVYLEGKPFQKVAGENLTIFRNADSKELPTRPLPPVGGYDVQLLFLSRPESTGPENTLGEYVNTFISMPAAKLEKEFSEEFKETAPKGRALALSKIDGLFALSGLYDTQIGAFIPSQDLAVLTGISKKLGVQPVAITEGPEEYFVIENAYQQLVFTTKGGALAEINLPFRSETNQKSVVKEIGFDRTMVSENPQNAHFPSHPFTVMTTEGKTQKERGVLGGYYPLLRRDLIEKPPYKSVAIPAQFYALNVVSEEYGEVGALNYKVTNFTERSITFEAAQPYRRIRKTFSVPEAEKNVPYILDCTVEIEGDARGLWLTTGVPEVEWINGGIAPALKTRSTRADGKSIVDSLTLPSPDLTSSSSIDWVCNSNGFFGMILDPISATEPGYGGVKVSGEVVPSRLVEIDQHFERFKAQDMPGYAMQLPFPPKGGKIHFRIYAGPFATSTLQAVDAHFSDPTTGYNPDYISSQTTHGWFTFISGPFSNFLFVLMRFFHSITGSWGFSIILLTLALRVMIYPLTAWSIRASKKMQEVGPELKRIQERYKNDPKKMNMEIATLYREKKVNPLSGCLPILIQLPFLLGMFDLLKSTFELRGASFIPGWIDNLAAPDVIFSWNYPLFFIGNELHLLPLLTAAAMFLQMKLMSPKKDPATMTEQERTQQAMGSVMSLPFAFIFYNAPSGLCLYWIFSTIFGVIQQKLTNGSAAPAAAPTVVEKGNKKKNAKR
ncbi:MAG: membrane protein insertase YidC [Chlamydiia bacterium]|nr:membrane protein insertase YidC [Chlamydiia bacterium]